MDELMRDEVMGEEVTNGEGSCHQERTDLEAIIFSQSR